MREEVRQFAELMERNLAAYDDRPRWKGYEWQRLWVRLHEELDDLGKALRTRSNPEHIASEAAHVGNLLMMLADVCGGLKELHPQNEVPEYYDSGDNNTRPPKLAKPDTSGSVWSVHKDAG